MKNKWNKWNEMNENNSTTTAVKKKRLFEHNHISKLKYALLYHLKYKYYKK